MNEKSMPCAYWREGEICAKGTEPGYTDFCVLGPCSQMKPSNADKIRQMSDEELAEFIERVTTEAISILGFGNGRRTKTFFEWLDWLKQEVESDG